MAENVMDQVVADLRAAGAAHYPQHRDLRNVRIVGHTPKQDHYIYDIVMDFADGSERLAAKVYRGPKCGPGGPKGMAAQELANLRFVHETFQKKRLMGVPRPVGDFTDLGAVVAEKFCGMPLQSIIMKAALLPGYADRGTLKVAARKTGEWLRNFHRHTADMPAPFDASGLVADLERLCQACKNDGLDQGSIETILGGMRQVLTRNRRTIPNSAVLNDFTPLNVSVGEQGIGICDYAKMCPRGVPFIDLANFLACVEALEKYPFCDRNITSQVQDEFLDAYNVNAADMALVRVMKMRTLLSMFAQGRVMNKEAALRKKVMWATVMKRFIHQAAQRSLSPAA